MTATRQSKGVGAFFLLFGSGSLAAQIGLLALRDVGDPAAFAAGLTGGLACYLGACLRLRGLTGRLVGVGALVWLVGWIAIAPAATAGSQTALYGGPLAVGCLLSAAAGTLRWQSNRTATPLVELTGWQLLLGGGALAVPAAVGLFIGPEAVALVSVILIAVAVILLSLFGPTA
jgi:hypothetical protein